MYLSQFLQLPNTYVVDMTIRNQEVQVAFTATEYRPANYYEPEDGGITEFYFFNQVGEEIFWPWEFINRWTFHREIEKRLDEEEFTL